jgi:hypothetical protein
MFWHPRLDHDPAQEWLRETIRSTCQTSIARAPAARTAAESAWMSWAP